MLKNKTQVTMATIKSYVDLEQSKKLAEILPIESADMYYFIADSLEKQEINYAVRCGTPIVKTDISCWSLSALLDILPNGTNIVKEEADTEDELYMCTVGTKSGIISTFGNNPVDACFEMVTKLHK